MISRGIASREAFGDIHRWKDGAFVAGAVIVSFILYIGHLGFYSDDWAFLGSLHVYGDHSQVGRPEFIDWAPYFRQRPIQVVYRQLLLDAFGLNPLGYHLMNSFLLTAMAVLFHLVLRELRLWRPLTIALAVVFGLLPHYSTDRYWFAAFGYVLSMALFFVSVYADLRGVRSTRRRLWGWKVLALAALLVSTLNYEVAVPLFVLSAVVLWRRYRTEPSAAGQERPRRGWQWLVASNVVAVIGVVIYKAFVTAGGPDAPPNPFFLHVARLAIGSVAINFGSLGVGMPQAVGWAARNSSPVVLAVGILLAIAVGAYLWWATAESSEGFPTKSAWSRVMAAGVVLFAASYTIFLPTQRILFTSTGINNRVGIAGALGVSMVFVGILGWICEVFFRRDHWRAAAFAAGVSAMTLAGFLVVNAQGAQWGAAWSEQQAVLARLKVALPSPEPNTVVILGGVCPYVGGAPVFESNWDVTGALEVTYGDATLMGDVTTANLTIGTDGLSTVVYGSLEARYPYGPRLLLFDAERAFLRPMTDVVAAQRWIAGTGPPRSRMPAGNRWLWHTDSADGSVVPKIGKPISLGAEDTQAHTMSLVTVVIPTRNRDDLLRLTLTSVLCQRDVPMEMEVVVVDDASDNRPGDVVAGQSDRRVRVVTQESQAGPNAARNRGIAEAAGEWISFCDDDDLWAPDKLGWQLRAALDCRRDWVYAGSVYVNEQLKVCGGSPPLPADAMVTALRRFNALPAAASNVAIRARLLRSIGEFDPELPHLADWELWIRLAERALPACVTAPLVAYRRHARNFSFRTAGMLRELRTLERRHGLTVDRSRYHRYLAHVNLAAGRRVEALSHFLQALLQVRDGYSRLEVLHDLRLLRQHAAEIARRKVGRPVSSKRAQRRLEVARIRDPHAAWKAQAQAWLDELQG